LKKLFFCASMSDFIKLGDDESSSDEGPTAPVPRKPDPAPQDEDESKAANEESAEDEEEEDSGSEWTEDEAMPPEERARIARLAKRIPYDKSLDTGFITLDPAVKPARFDPKDRITSVIDPGGVAASNEDTLASKLKKVAESHEEKPPPPKPKLSKREKREKAEESPKTARGWFDMPAAEQTPEFKKFMRLIHLREHLFKNRHYKKIASRSMPRFAQVGTVLPGAGERMPDRKKRKRTWAEEVLGDDEMVWRKGRYDTEIGERGKGLRRKNPKNKRNNRTKTLRKRQKKLK